ncbi:type II toxin-antitoxin system VapC family toxin [Oribacterium sp. FC2011]|uniref:type II toxin-antitoxin system VapC family toxin n=1 Tax=Oribacterium sp. FC2011 TaxID=1408311 RepID=UPI0004E1DDB0|nr:PIN domain-containing protein [Oribacterium sp. FC2011]
MKLLIDGNILLDVLQKREPHYEDSSKIWKMCETDLVEGYVSALTFANLVYIMRKELDAEKISEILKKMSLIFSVEDLTVSDLSAAAEMQWEDFEDALQAATANRIHAECIITRNVKDFKKSKVIAYTPTEFLARQ